MFESSKNDLAQQVLFTERIRTLLFLSMMNDIPISILYFPDGGKISQAIVITGIVGCVNTGHMSNPFWKRSISGSFYFNTDKDRWFEICKIYAVSFTNLIEIDPVAFVKHKDILNRTQHLGPVMPNTGRRKFHIEIDDDNDSKFYRILSSTLSS
ncbi:MAG: hypothetical protein FP810_10235 [Desulfocapsa sp.]|jgi:hypothetical protein|nr:hypothetical protein [Desulfocapsa sp.]MBU3945141.1 hypothetical protein [Pseudomonadota bacterium]